MMWTVDQVAAARRLYLKGSRSVESPVEPFMNECRRVLAAEAKERLGLTLDGRDMRIGELERPHSFAVENLFTWAPQDRPVELFGGPRDGAIFPGITGAGEYETVRIPRFAPVRLRPPADPLDQTRFWFEYRLHGWNPVNRCWVYRYIDKEV